MKFLLGLATTAAMAVTPTTAFTANLSTVSHRDIRLAATRVDSSTLIDEAMKLTKKFGATSAEARLAWEAVEEIDSSDNSAATMGNLNEECEVEVEVVSQDCVEYGEALDEVQDLIASTEQVGVSTSGVEPVKLSAQSGVTGTNSPELKAALEEAQTVTLKMGIASSEAKLAWETVEEIAASGNNNALGGVLGLIDTADALEELNKKIL